MLFAAASAMPLRSAGLKLSLFALGLVTLLLPATARAQGSCTLSSGVVTCTSTDVIATPDEGADDQLYVADKYPSTMTVPSSLVGSATVSKVQVQLTSMDSNGSGNYLSVQGTEIVLAAPSGTNMELFGGPGNGSDTMSGLTILIGDGFSAMPNGNPAGMPASGTVDYEPSSYLGGYGFGNFPSPGPGQILNFPQTQGSDTLASIFAASGGVTAAGNWKLWMIDNLGDPVTVNGWKLILTLNQTEVGTTTTVASSQQPVYVTSPTNSVTFTATVTSSSGTPSGGTVSFYANGSTTPISCSGGNQTVNGSGQATCTITLSEASASQCSSSTLPAWPAACQGITAITATYSGSGSYSGSTGSVDQLVEVHPTLSGTTWCNTAPAPIQGIATPAMYPSVITVSGYPNGTTVSNVIVELEGATGPSGIDDMFLLVAPNGQNLDFLDNGFSAIQPSSPANLTFDDTAGQFVPGTEAATTGNYEATDNRTFASTFSAATAPSLDANIPQVPGTIHYAQYGASTTGTTFFGTTAYNFGQTFNNAPANGDWALYVNGYSGAEVSLNSGWCIDLALNTGAATTMGIVSSQQKALTGQSVTFTATVTSGGDPVTSGTVTFEDNGVTPAGTVGGNNVVALNGSGQATFTTSSLAEGDHDFTADYSGVSGTYNANSTSLYQREDKATTISSVTSTGAQFCNTGGVTNPNRSFGAFSPNPSNIFVENLPGTISSVTVALDNLDIPDTDTGVFGLESLLAGPQAALDFFSVPDGSGAVSEGNYIFTDSGSTLSTSNIGPGTYKPASDDSTADTFFQDPGEFYKLPTSFQYAPIHGSATLTSVFGNSNPNGTWSLYFNQTESGTTGPQSGWCLNFTENPPTVTATTESTDTFTQGQPNAPFTINIDNTGTTGPTGDPTGTNPMTVTDTLNSAFTYSTYSGTNWSCSASGQTVTCTNDSAIAQGSSYPALTIDVNVSPTASGNKTNSVSVSGAGVSSTSSNTDTVTIEPAPVLAVSKTHTGTFTQGSTAEWDITVSNAASGGVSFGTVNVSDALPSGYTVYSFGSTSASWSCTGTSTVSCSTTLTEPGGSSFPTIQVIVNVPANSPTSVSNTALAWGGGDLTHTSSGTAASGTDTATVMQVAASITANAGTTPQSANTGTAFANNLAVTVEDAGGVAVNGATVTFIAPASGASGTFAASGNNVSTATTNSSGVATASVFTANGTPGGPYTVAASVTGLSSVSFSLTNTYVPVATSYQIIVPASAYAGQAFNVTVTVYDQLGNLDTSYTGTVHFTSTDGAAMLPANTTLSAGTGTFQATLVTPGNQTITATDTVSSGLTATSSQIVVTIPNLVVTVATDDAGQASNCTIQTTAETSTDASCSLRDALLEAGSIGSSSITFSSTAFASTNTVAANTITLTNGSLSIPSNTTITGPASGSGYTLTNLVTVNGAAASSVFSVNTGVTGANLSGLTISNGSAGSGGGIANNGELAVSNSTLSANSSSYGGGIWNNGVITVTNSTFSDHASVYGGGIYNQGTLTVTNSTFSGNTVSAGGLGGGIYNAGTTTATNSTFSANNAGSGGGIWNNSGSLSLANSIVSGNTATSNPDLGGSYTDNGGNQVGASGISLAPLANYGGPTQTMVALPGSPAICAGTLANATAARLTTDQRGLPFDANCPSGSVDSGAVQSNYALAFTTEPPASATVGVALSPAPVVGLTESGAVAAVPTGVVTMTDSAGLLVGTDSVNLSSGSATFSNLVISAVTSSDTLTATLALTSSLNLTAQASVEPNVGPAYAVLTSPVPGSTLTGQTVIFTWSSGSGVAAYQLWLGTTRVGSNNLYDSGSTTATSVTVTVPAYGVTVFARLYSKINGTWQSADYTYTEYGTLVAAMLNSPTPGSTLTGSSATFSWAGGSGPAAYELWLGTTGVGSQNLYNSGSTTATSATVNNLPTNGVTVFARLYQLIDGKWQSSDYTYTEQ